MDRLPFEVFLQKHFIFSMAVASLDDPYCAPCFYIYLPDVKKMMFLSDPETTHMKTSLLNARIAGSVYRETEDVLKIQGVQFRGQLDTTNKGEIKQVLKIYYQRFPYARFKPATPWMIQLNWVKFTDNTRGFGYKETWERECFV